MGRVLRGPGPVGAVLRDQAGDERPDVELYRSGELGGGLAFTPGSLRSIFADLTEVELRRMRDEPPDSPLFGEEFLWTALFRG